MSYKGVSLKFRTDKNIILYFDQQMCGEGLREGLLSGITLDKPFGKEINVKIDMTKCIKDVFECANEISKVYGEYGSIESAFGVKCLNKSFTLINASDIDVGETAELIDVYESHS